MNGINQEVIASDLVNDFKLTHPDGEKIATFLEKENKANPFFGSLWMQLRSKGTLSPKQIEAINRSITTSKSVRVHSMKGVISLLEKATGFAKLTFKLTSDLDLCLYKATARSKFHGQIQLTSNPKGLYFGRLTPQGELFLYKDATPVKEELVNLLNRLASNPEKVASEYGKITGSCSFCRRTLTDAVSRQVGYGKTCAGKYGLPYGKGGV